MSSASRRTVLLALGALAAPACLSPTLPLPPPDRPDVEPIGSGQYRLTGAIPVAGTVLVLNPRTDLVHGQVADLAYDFVIPAEVGDVLYLWYEAGLESSDAARFEIEDPSPPVPDAGAADGG